MDLRSVRNQLSVILSRVRQSQASPDPYARADWGKVAVGRILELITELDAHIDALPAAETAAAAARTACREHLYPRPAPPCIHEDDGQEEAGMGEPACAPAPWKSPD